MIVRQNYKLIYYFQTFHYKRKQPQKVLSFAAVFTICCLYFAFLKQKVLICKKIGLTITFTPLFVNHIFISEIRFFNYN